MMTLIARISEGETTAYTESTYQYNKNTTLEFEGVDLPDEYEVHFSNDKERGISVSRIGSAVGVLIPDELLSTGEYVYAWLYGTAKSGKVTLFMVTIPVIPRPVPIYSESSSGDGKFKYDVVEDEENLIFHSSAMDRAMIPNIEEDD